MSRPVLICMLVFLDLFVPVWGQEPEADTLMQKGLEKPAGTVPLQTESHAILLKPEHSGDGQHARINVLPEEPLRVRVIREDGVPVEGETVQFRILTMPQKSEGFSLLNETALTDSAGLASTQLVLGSKPGEYQVSARIKSHGEPDMQVFTLHARKSNWVFLLIIGLLGGLGLFLLGMDMMSEGMKKSAGDKMRTILGSLTSNRLVALGLGTFVTMVIQSSSATSVMLVGFVNSRLMKFRRTIGIILGANIGTTVTAQLIAFKLTDYSLLLVALGFSLLYFSKKQGYRYLGQAILGFGILFFGMHVMSEAMYPLRTFPPFINLLLELENPLLGILTGMVFTALLQSSSAFIGIIIVLAAQGLLTLEAGIPLLIGSNIGTAITAFLASIKASREAKKVALANAFINLFGMLLFVWWISQFAGIVEYVSPKSALPAGETAAMAETIPRQIANAHTLFNVVVAFLLIPVTGRVAGLIDRVLPEKPVQEEEMMKTLYLDEQLISTPALGLNLAKQEALRVGSIVQDMVSDSIIPFLVKQEHVLEDLANRERQVDYLVAEVSDYLMKMIRQSVETERAEEAFQIMYTIKELEEIADITGNLLVTRAKVWIESKAEFSEAGKKELLEYHTKTQKQLARALEVFRDLNLEKAKAMKAKYKEYRSMASELEKLHYERLRDKGKRIEASGDTHMELMTRFRTVTHHATNIARILLEWKGKKKKNAANR